MIENQRKRNNSTDAGNSEKRNSTSQAKDMKKKIETYGEKNNARIDKAHIIYGF